MAEEFVDLYQVLDLPLDADRGTVRKRINELYLDAQRNIDHRNFATRVKFQELFEVTLPQARYILLDDGRRDEYNRLVHAFRSPGSAAPPPATGGTSAPASDAIPQFTSGFSFETPQNGIPGSAPPIEPLPPASVDPEQLAQEREELWKKWKSGLEAALTVEDSDKPKSRGAVTSAPTAFSVAPSPSASPVSSTPTPAAPAPVTPPLAAPKTAARPKVDISFDFVEKETDAGAPTMGVVQPNYAVEDLAPTLAEMEARRTEHRRQITKDILVNVGLIWGIAGALFVIVPGVAALIAAVGHYYPRGAKPLLGYPSIRLWAAGFLLISIAAFFASRELSKAMRRKKATSLSFLSYEEVLKQTGKS